MRTISIGIPELMLEEVDRLISENKKFQSRSEVLRYAIELMLKDELPYYKTLYDSRD